MIPLEGCVKALTQHGEHAYLLQHGDSHQYAQEEHNRREVNAGEQVAHTLGHCVILRRVIVEYLRHRPEHAEHQQDAHERGQMGDRLEHRHEAQPAHAKPEDDIPLGFGELADLRFRQIQRLVELSAQLVLQDQGRHQHRH